MIAIGDAHGLAAGAALEVAGRVLATEGGALLLADGTGTLRVETLVAAPPGTWVRARGTWAPDTGTLRADEVELHPPPAPGLPAAGEFAHATATLPSGRTRFGNLRARARIVRAVRSYFDDAGFLEVETPLAVPCPGLDLHLDAVEAVGLGAERWLATSPEYQMKRLLAAGHARIYQVCRCFRRGELGPRHQPEFTMLEWYRAFAGSADVMRDTEEVVARAAVALHGTTRVRAPNGEVDLSPPWERLTVAEALARHAGARLDEVLPDEERFFRLLVDRVEPALGAGRPTWLTAWPASMASLARLLPGDPSLADRFEAYVGGVELCNGFGELVDPVEQRARFERDRAARRATGKPVYAIDERLLAALAEGVPPSAGNALGVDRLVALLLGEPDVADVVAIDARRL